MKNKERIKLFSKKSIQRRKLFSSNNVEVNEGGITLKTVKCQDCGHEIETASNVDQILCPKCGGKRFNLVMTPESPEQVVEGIKISRLSLFSKDTDFEEKVKTYSGQTISEEEFQREFSGDYVFATRGEDGSYTINPNAYATEKLFSKLIIQVTKVLDLDEDIMKGEKKPEDVISNLEEHESIPEKGIMIIKKAHGLIPPFASNFSETEEPVDESGETWLNDSNRISDLQVEFSNNSFGIKQFMDILKERYEDAPENIVDLLLNHNAIRIEGNSVTINK